jgi:hypothetical protein
MAIIDNHTSARMMSERSWLQRLWSYPPVVEFVSEEEFRSLLKGMRDMFLLDNPSHARFLFGSNRIDVSLLRFYVMYRLLCRDSGFLHPLATGVGLLCVNIDHLERPYQFFFTLRSGCGDIDFTIRGATTDQLMATGTWSVGHGRYTYCTAGASTWHSTIEIFFHQHSRALGKEFEKILANSTQHTSKFKICIDTYSNIGHALQNEIGPLLLLNRIFKVSRDVVSSGTGPYRLADFFNCSDDKIFSKSISKRAFQMANNAHIYRDCLIPTGSNPMLGIYASYKLGGLQDERVTKSAKDFRSYISEFDDVVYVSPRVDRKRSLCANQHSLICTFLRELDRKAHEFNHRVLVLFEKLWIPGSANNKEHNSFVEHLMCKYGQQSRHYSLALACLPELELQEKLYILRAATAFIGAGGANLCTFFDWQGNEVPGIIYGDYDLIIRGGYFKEFLHSRFSGRKIPGRYVLFGEVAIHRHIACGYSIDELQLSSAVDGLVAFLLKTAPSHTASTDSSTLKR